jgi:saccharopine dehydrogenase (NAD+, L-lysine-forming)
MNKIIRIGILKETKSPPDHRVPFTPAQIRMMKEMFPGTTFFIQPSEIRCIADHEYANEGIEMKNDLSDCEILIGIKEVNIDTLIPDKTYMFFSHTGKKQPHNRSFFREMAEKRITLIDYEYLTDQNNLRLVAFGRWAGIVGAYNGLRAWGERYNLYQLKPAHHCFNLEEMKLEIRKVSLPPIKILVSGGGRVAGGAMETIALLNIREIGPEDYLNKDFNEPVICRIDPWHYAIRKNGSEFDLDHFISQPDQYESAFKPYTKVTDLFMACHFWDPASPVLIDRQDMQESGFRIKVIADISCDINGSIRSTIRASSIDNPFYGYHPGTGTETAAFDRESITVMAVDNLPGELPRDASEDFGRMLMDRIIPALLEEDSQGIISRATILKDGKLTTRFSYLRNYLEGF